MKTKLFLLFLMLFLGASKVMAATVITAPCDSTTHQTQWFAIGPDSSADFQIVAGADANGKACDIQTTAWNRDHWTITCWVTGSSSSQTSYTCHNWNTVWGDTWHASFSYMACPQGGCVTGDKEKAMIKAIEGNIKTKDTRLMRGKSAK